MTHQKTIPLFKTIVGSNAYGTNIETSDIDIKGVYIQNPFDVGSFIYQPQQIIDKDTIFWEIQRFLELACSSNPTVLELLFSPKRCILEKHPLFDIILQNRYLFLTKQCKNSFLGYARQQIYKAKGLNKKMNWESEKTERKKPIDFCKFLWFGKNDIRISNKIDIITLSTLTHQLAITKIDNTKQLYKLWYIRDYDFSYKLNPFCNNDELLVSALPKNIDASVLAIIQYDLDGFQKHCREYNQYQTWLKERNEERYVDVNNHNQKIDGKNIMHCVRLMETAKDIVEKGDLIVERPNAKELLKIRQGYYNLQELIDKLNKYFREIEQLFDNSNLPDSIDKNLINTLLIDIRKKSLKLF